MFVRTERLTLRPGWIEDAPALAQAIGHWDVVSKLARVPWPYGLGDAQRFLANAGDRHGAFFLICAHDGGTTHVVGGMGFAPDDRGEQEFGYWLTPAAWGRGYATEAGRAVVRTARESLRVKRLVSGHFIDNPASGKVLRKQCGKSHRMSSFTGKRVRQLRGTKTVANALAKRIKRGLQA